MKIFLSCLFITLFSTLCQAHSWYPYSCCGGQDCHPVACESISETKDGYEYKSALGTVYKFKTAQPSLDNHCHVCISNEDSDDYVTHCLFIQFSS